MTRAKTATAAPRVVIGVPTLRRPQSLARLLSALPATARHALDAGACSEVAILVVDNDPSGSAATTVASSPLPARYVAEPLPGLAAVRNRILDETIGYDLLVLIDDDETPAEPAWLRMLLDTRAHYDAAAVAGPVRTVVAQGIDPWVDAGAFFARGHRSGMVTGTPIRRAATNNLLLDRAAVAAARVRFDERFGRSGGEDSLFTEQLSLLGMPMVWCAGAIVLDHLDGERTSRRHALARVSGMAAAGVRVRLALTERPLRRGAIRIGTAARAALRGARGASLVFAGALTRSMRRDAVGWRELARAAGEFRAAAGRTDVHYGDAPTADPGKGRR